MQDHWTLAACIKELTAHGWIYEGVTTFGGSPQRMYRWANPTTGEVHKCALTLRSMRDLCRQKFPEQP